MKIEDLHNDLPQKIPVEICDKIQFFLRSNADQQMRFVIFLSQQIDFNIVQKALRATIYNEPIFSYSYKEDNKNAYWQKEEKIDSALLIDLIETDDVLIEVNRFLTLSISPFAFPLVKTRIIRNDSKDVICINMNHTPTDGAGLKKFVKILANNYNNILENPDYTGDANINGDRSVKQVLKSFTFLQKLQFARQGFKQPKRSPSWSFGWNKSDSENKNLISTIKITAETFNKIKVFGKQHNATINDIILSAFIRVFVSTNPKNEKAAKPLIVPVDLRKHIKPGQNTAICSLTGSMICNIGNDIGESYVDTLDKVREEMIFKKSIHAEMNMLSPFLVLSKLMPYGKLKDQTMKRKTPPIPLVTNVGIINSSDINFNNIPVENSYITGAILYGDYFCMGYSTFNNEITFSVGFTGGNLQIQKVNLFLDKLKKELENI